MEGRTLVGEPEMFLPGDFVAHGPDHPRFAEAGLRGEQDDLALTPDRPIPPFNDEPKFVIAADQLSEGVGVRSFKSVFRRTFAEYTPSRDRFVETL